MCPPELRVIAGGVDPSGPPPIAWGRQPIDPDRRALVIRPAEGTRDRLDLAWDDGRPFLVGIRSVAPEDVARVVAAWSDYARLIGAEVRDERPALLGGSVSPEEALRRETWRRDARRQNQPLPEGSLFDFTARDQRGLFEEG